MTHFRTLSALLLLAACTGAPPADAPAPDTDAAADMKADEVPAQVAKALVVAKAVQADPSKAEAALEANGMSRDEFEALMYEIAADPELSRAYAAGLDG